VTAHWNMPFNGDGAFGGIADNEEDFYLTIQRGVMYKMKLDTNGNRLSFNRMDPISVDSNDYMFINPMVMDKNADILYMAARNKLWRNNNISNIPYNNSHNKSDFGWEMFSDTLSNPNMQISVIETSKYPANIIYLGTQNKYIYRIDNANTGDPSLVQLPSILTGLNSYCYDIAINPDNADEIIVVYSNYSVYSLFHSNDGGQSWTKIAGNLEQNPSGTGNGPSCRSAEIIPLGNSTLYLVGTSVGLFGTANLNGENTVWEQVASQEIGSVVCEYLTYRQNDGLLVVATHGNGIYQTNLSNIGDVLDVSNVNHSRSLKLDIFPNPTSDILNASFSIDRNVDVELLIYDELGRCVFDTQKYCKKGPEIIECDISFLRSGIYFVSLKIDGNIFITKQIIKNNEK
tara:strand:- start:115 stop:1320 length:1206 start_codon:yes stop_codon:yes gene_type:complete